eukprot:304520-Hanusia_phi.AAC.4
MLRAQEERGALALVLLEARNAGKGAESRRVIRGGKLAGGLAVLEMISCCCESMVLMVASNALLTDMSKSVMPRKTPCPLDDQIAHALLCSLQRDVLAIASSLVVICTLVVYLSWRYSSFFGVGFKHVCACMLKCGKVSTMTAVVCFLMVLGFLQQLYMQRRLNKQLFGVDNFMEGELGFSLHRLLELIVRACL